MQRRVLEMCRSREVDLQGWTLLQGGRLLDERLTRHCGYYLALSAVVGGVGLSTNLLTVGVVLVGEEQPP
jgi:hypothetical protein